MNICIKLTTIISIIAFSGTAVLALDTTPENLPALVETAIRNNPELKSSQARWRMFEARARQAGSLDDPKLMLKLQNGVVEDLLNFRREPMTSKVIGISQQLPFWGKRGLREEIAEKNAEYYRRQIEERRLELARMVKETYYRIYYVDRSREVVERNIRTMDDFVKIAETKYTVGQGRQQDVLKAQVERSKLVDMRISLEQERKSLAAALNSLLSRPAGTAVGAVADIEIRPAGKTADELKRIALEKRPQLKGLKALVEKGEAGRKLAGKEFYPDFNVSLEYMQREPVMGGQGADMYTLGVTFNLPLQRERRHAMVAESNAETGMAAEELNALLNSIDSGISDLLAKLEKREKLASLYKTGIIPQAEQSLESAMIGYQVNKVDFLTLLDSRVTLFNYERDYYASLAEHRIALARLEALVGADLADPISSKER